MIDVSIDKVSKKYRIQNPESSASPLRRVVNRFVPPAHDFWALREISFEVRRGETTGVIGRNGAGKSTLMKLLSGITAPTEGQIRIRGRLAALIELGSGFHPELTGRENVFMSAAILGMRRREIQAKFDSIVEFADIGEFIDVPVKWYSSGMYVRLGFAIAAHIDADVLLVDEVLAVGDGAFRNKCFNRIEELKRAGTTILMITHDLSAIERLASRAVLLEHGAMKAIGPAKKIVAEYQHSVHDASPVPGSSGLDDRPVAVTQASLMDRDGSDVSSCHTGGSFRLRIGYTAVRPFRDPVFHVLFYGADDGALHTECSSAHLMKIDAIEGDGVVEFDFPVIGLQPGVYTIGVTIGQRGAAEATAWQFGRLTLYVQDGHGLGGRFYMPYRCCVRSEQTTEQRLVSASTR